MTTPSDLTNLGNLELIQGCLNACGFKNDIKVEVDKDVEAGEECYEIEGWMVLWSTMKLIDVNTLSGTIKVLPAD